MNKLIEEILNKVTESDSKNRFCLENIKIWLSEELAIKRDEIARFPGLKDEPYWLILIVDADLKKDSFFLFLYSMGRG